MVHTVAWQSGDPNSIMKLFELQKCPLCGMMRCDHTQTNGNDVCPICSHHPCECTDEQEEVNYQGKKIMVGKHKDDSDTRFDPDELSMGIEDEIKHTNDDKRVAKNIAKDHLIQMPNYYSRQRQSHNSLKEWLNETDEWESDTSALNVLYKRQLSAIHHFQVELHKLFRLHITDENLKYFLTSDILLWWSQAPSSTLSIKNFKHVLIKFPNLIDPLKRILKAKRKYEKAGGTYVK